MNRHCYNILFTILWLLPALSSCRQELCYDHYPAIESTLNWEQEWERDYGMSHATAWDPALYGMEYSSLRPPVPEAVTLLRYTSDGNATERYFSPQGGKIAVDPGQTSSMLFYNNDTEYIVLSDVASLVEARATTTSRSRSTISYLESKHPGTRSTNPPDAFYAAFIENVPAIAVHENYKIPVKMQPLVFTYLIRYEFDEGIEHVAIARGAIGGMAESVYLRTGKTSDQSAIILFDCEKTSYGCEARVRSFGVPGFPDEYYGQPLAREAARPYTLNLEVKLNNGKTKEFNFDISDQMAKQPRGGVITVKGIDIDRNEALYESGFEVDVSGWGNSEDIDLPVGVNK